jgi:hypothetical protein
MALSMWERSAGGGAIPGGHPFHVEGRGSTRDRRRSYGRRASRQVAGCFEYAPREAAISLSCVAMARRCSFPQLITSAV